MPQVWLITGSSRGLGRELSKAVLAAGHVLVATARDPSQLTDLVELPGNDVRAARRRPAMARFERLDGLRRGPAES
jgi:NAD(P)-dependent dehydrogenase (short-subunit alcohol dehydrogenase family)